MAETKNEHRMFMGIGDAILRLVHVERMYADGVDPGDVLESERKLIVEALNQQYQLDLGFDCNMDGVPDTVEIFMQSAQTSCCRILPMDDGPKDSAPKKRSSSRKKFTAPVAPVISTVVEPEPESVAAATEPEPKTPPKKKRRSSRRRTKK